ncbi:MAG: hypothetical protein ACFFDN_50870 [Candidatus Hodarchaeota archaeon]
MLRAELGDLEKEILEIALKTGAKKRPIDIDDLYKASVSQLAYSKEDITRSIMILLQKRYLIEGHELTKANLLNHEKRKQIYEYVKKNPGANNREIRRTFNLGSYDTFRNLEYLEMFGFIRSKEFMNKKAYFLFDSDESEDERILVLRNNRTKLIFEQISNQEKIRLFEIERNLNLSHGQIQPHIKKLIDYKLVELVVENKIKYYTIKNSQLNQNIKF